MFPAVLAAWRERSHCQFREQHGELRPGRRTGPTRRAPAHPHHNVNACQAVANYAELLPHQPFNPVTVHCARRRFPADDDTDTRLRQAIWPAEQDEMTARSGCARSQCRSIVFAML